MGSPNSAGTFLRWGLSKGRGGRGAHLYVPDVGAVEELWPHLAYFVDVFDIPDIDAVVPIHTGQPLVDGVEGQCHCIGVDCFCLPAEEEANKATQVTPITINVTRSHLWWHSSCLLPGSTMMVHLSYSKSTFPGSLFLCFVSDTEVKKWKLLLGPWEHLNFQLLLTFFSPHFTNSSFILPLWAWKDSEHIPQAFSLRAPLTHDQKSLYKGVREPSPGLEPFYKGYSLLITYSALSQEL